MDTLTARVEDSLLQQSQHIGAERHLLTTGETLGFVLQARWVQPDWRPTNWR